jgi:hypothetical protein
MALFGPFVPPVPRFRPNLGFHSSAEPRPSPAFRSALGDSGRNKNARNVERVCGVGHRKGSSSPFILFPSKMHRIYPFSLPNSPTVVAPPLLFHHHVAEEDRRRRRTEGEKAAGAKREAAGLDKRNVGGRCGAPADRNTRRAGREKKLAAKRAEEVAADGHVRLVSMSMGQPRVGQFPGPWPT